MIKSTGSKKLGKWSIGTWILVNFRIDAFHNKENVKRLFLLSVLFSGAIDVGSYLLAIAYNRISPAIPVPSSYTYMISFPVLLLVLFPLLVFYKRARSQIPFRTGIPHKISSEENEGRNGNIEDNFNGGGIYENKP